MYQSLVGGTLFVCWFFFFFAMENCNLLLTACEFVMQSKPLLSYCKPCYQLLNMYFYIIWWKDFHEYNSMGTNNFDFLKKNHAYPIVSAVMFCKQFLAYAVHIDRCYHAIHKHSWRSTHISVLTTSTFMLGQVCTIEPSFFKTTSGMLLRPFEGRYLVFN